MTTKIRRRRRCVLSVPGSSMRKIEKAMGSGVDHVFLDLEDAVAPSAKPEARHNVVHAFNEGDWGNTVRCFRMNGLDTEYAYNDLITVVEGAGQNIDTLMIPKVKYARDVEWVDTFLSQIERKMGFENKIGLELLIEEVEGIANINAISLASDRVEALHFGIGDYVRAQGVDIRDAFGQARHYPGDIFHHQRSTLAVAARVIGGDYIDGPWGLIPKMDAYRNECRMVKTLGGVGKWAIHPSQIPVAMAEFGPSKEEVEMAKLYIAQMKEAREQGIGAIKTAEGGMLDEAALPLLQAILDSAEFYGVTH